MNRYVLSKPSVLWWRTATKSSILQTIALLALFVVATVSAQAGTLISFAPPAGGYAASSNGVFTATLQLKGSSDPGSLHVTLGAHDLSSMFQAKCAQVPCTVSVTLTTTSGIQPGMNMLLAKVHGANSSVDQARQQFVFTSVAAASPTAAARPDASPVGQLGHFVPVQQTGTTITLMTPTPTTITPCGGGLIRIAIFNRTDLTIKQAGSDGLGQCYQQDTSVGAVLGQTSQSDLIVINAAYGTGNADFSNMGGSSSGATKLGYYAIGFGLGSIGTDFEAWLEQSGDSGLPKTVSGLLVDIGCNSQITACGSNTELPLYIFQPTNAMGFAMIPGAANTGGASGLPSIYVGNPKALPMNGNDPPPAQVLPTDSLTSQSLFNYKSYTPIDLNDLSSDQGGFYLVVLNRSDLSLLSGKTFMTNTGSAGSAANDNNAVGGLAQALTPTNPSPNNLFLLTSFGTPFTGRVSPAQVATVVAAIANLGVPAATVQALVPDQFGTPPGTGFSMVGYQGSVSGTQVGSNSTNGDVVAGVTLSGPQKLYSTASNGQQGETGALQGVFAKGHTAYYEATDVSSFNPSSLPVYATGDNILSSALTYAIGTSEPVAWPVMDTPGRQNAYAWLSDKILTNNLKVLSGSAHSGDIRYFYASSSNSNIFHGLTPEMITCPGDQNGFSEADCAAVQQQLETEEVYLGEVIAYQEATNQLNSATEFNIGNSLSSAGATITTDLNTALGTSAEAAGTSKIKLAKDILDTGKLVANVLPATAAIKMLVDISTNIIGYVEDTKSEAPKPDPYVTQLANLTASTTTSEDTISQRYSTDELTASNVFFNGVYADWFRLQSVAVLTQDQDFGGWFQQQASTDITEYLNSISAGVRANLYQQILPQYFNKVAFTDIATGYRTYSAPGNDVNQNFSNFLTTYAGPDYAQGTKLSDFNSYSWEATTTPGYNICQDYDMIFLAGHFGKTWPSSFGDMLFGNASSGQDGASELNLDRNFVFNNFDMPWLASFPQAVTSQTQLRGEPSWKCTDYPNLFVGSVQFQNLTPSQTVVAGTNSIYVTGTVSGSYPAVGGASGGTFLPIGSVHISIGTVQLDTPLNPSPGSNPISSTFGTTIPLQGLAASPVPYAITYSYSSAVATFPLFAVGSDVSTSLTINSTNTETSFSTSNPSITPNYANQGLQVLVKSPKGVPSGNVQIFVDGAPGASQAVTQDGFTNEASAIVSHAQLSVGTHTFVAMFHGANGFEDSTSDPFFQNVTSLSLTASSLQIGRDGNLTLTATVNPVPTGTPFSYVIFYDGSAPISVGIPTNDGTATFNTATLTPGTHALSAVLTLGGGIAPDNSNTVGVVVNKYYTNLRSTISPAAVQYGTATVPITGVVVQDDANATIEGYLAGKTLTVTVGTISQSVTTDSAGVFTTNFPILNFSAGTYPIRIDYPGDAVFGSMSDSSLQLTINKGTTNFSNLTAVPSGDTGSLNVAFSGVLSSQPSSSSILKYSNPINADYGGTVLNYDPTGVSTNSATYSMWIKTSAKTQQMLFETAYVRPYIYMQNDQLGVLWPDAGSGWLSTDTTPISDGRWHHITVTFNQGNIAFYKDGIPTNDSFTVSSAASAASPINLGGSWSQIPSFSGEIWNAKIWSKVLVPADIQSDMYAVYGGILPSSLNFSYSVDPVKNLVVNTVNQATAPIDARPTADPQIATDVLPALFPATTDQVAATMNKQTTALTISPTGTFFGVVAQDNLAVGNYPITYNFAGDANFNPATDNSTSLVIQSATTTTTVTASQNPITPGSQVTFTAMVGSTHGAVLDGTITFYDGNVVIGQNLALSNGGASLSTSNLVTGIHPITAVYSGSTTYKTSTSTIYNETVSSATLQGTSIKLVPSWNPAWTDFSLTFTATIMATDPKAGTPSGTVTCTDVNTVGTNISRGSLGTFPITNGMAACTVGSLLPGTHSITAFYNGSGTFASSSTTFVEVVYQHSPVFTGLTTPKIVYGAAYVTLSGTIAAGNDVPPGPVTITVNGKTTLAAVNPATGKFTSNVPTSTFPVGVYSVTYDSPASAKYSAATDAKTTIAVSAAPTSLTLSASAPSTTFGSTVTFTAKVSSPVSVVPTGTVTFSEGGSTLGTGSLSNGGASFQTATLSAGAHTITATFNGGANFSTSYQTVSEEITGSLGSVGPGGGSGVARVQTSVTLSKLADGKDEVIVSVQNVGTAVAKAVDLSGLSIGSVKELRGAISLGNIKPGVSRTVSIPLGRKAGLSGKLVEVRTSGRYRGGAFEERIRLLLP